MFGSVVIPEQPGNVELVEFNNNPPRFRAGILYNANCNTVMPAAARSLFFHPYLDISYLQHVVQGLQAMGYAFVPMSTVTKG